MSYSHINNYFTFSWGLTLSDYSVWPRENNLKQRELQGRETNIKTHFSYIHTVSECGALGERGNFCSSSFGDDKVWKFAALSMQSSEEREREWKVKFASHCIIHVLEWVEYSEFAWVNWVTWMIWASEWEWVSEEAASVTVTSDFGLLIQLWYCLVKLLCQRLDLI